MQWQLHPTHPRVPRTAQRTRSAPLPSSAHATRPAAQRLPGRVVGPTRAPEPARGGGEVARDLDALPLFVKPPDAPDTTPTSVLQVLDAVQAAAGWGAETRATPSDDAELARERVDRELEGEFEGGERADRALFAAGLRPMPHASKRGVPPNAPFMACA